jgi:hypothetical protein
MERRESEKALPPAENSWVRARAFSSKPLPQSRHVVKRACPGCSSFLPRRKSEMKNSFEFILHGVREQIADCPEVPIISPPSNAANAPPVAAAPQYNRLLGLAAGLKLISQSKQVATDATETQPLKLAPADLV